MVLKKKSKRNYWKEEEEDLLKGWADKSQCYQWMHMKSHQVYQKKNAYYTIPVIIISTVTGTANFAQERFSDKAKPYVSIIIGSLSLIAGIITTVYQFLKISELNEGHRVAALSWGKFYRDINTELVKHPLDRMPPDLFMKKSKEEYDRLIEISPFILKKILYLFNNKFKNNTDLIKPEIGDIINSTGIYSMDKQEREKMIKEINRDVIISNKILDQKETQKTAKIKQFRESFFQLNNRYPNEQEMNMKNQYIEELDASINKDDLNLSDSTDDENNDVNSDDLENGTGEQTGPNNDTDSRTSVV